MSGKCLGGCKEFAEHYQVKFDCCSSCHNEWFYEEGEPLEHTVKGSDDYFMVCCCALVAIEEGTEDK